MGLAPRRRSSRFNAAGAAAAQHGTDYAGARVIDAESAMGPRASTSGSERSRATDSAAASDHVQSYISRPQAAPDPMAVMYPAIVAMAKDARDPSMKTRS
jgi:hypothetical protein